METSSTPDINRKKKKQNKNWEIEGKGTLGHNASRIKFYIQNNEINQEFDSEILL